MDKVVNNISKLKNCGVRYTTFNIYNENIEQCMYLQLNMTDI